MTPVQIPPPATLGNRLRSDPFLQKILLQDVPLNTGFIWQIRQVGPSQTDPIKSKYKKVGKLHSVVNSQQASGQPVTCACKTMRAQLDSVLGQLIEVPALN